MTGRHEPYHVSAYNTAKQSENKMHDDAVAQRFGFSGGLVPGVDVMAYMMHLPVAQWGRAFLERGRIDARFVKPVYDGETAVVTAAEVAGGFALRVESRGELCAIGSAALPASAPQVQIAQFPDTPPVATRLPVNSASYELGQWLGTAPQLWDGEALSGYLADVRESDPIYTAEGLQHPGILQRIMNRALVENAMLGPWIHVGSEMQLLSVAAVGDRLTARAKVTGNYDKKGHRFVELDALIVADEIRPVAHCHHVAIVEPRAQTAA
jgi:acyl dehydratase